MNHTTNLHLPQWEETDRIQMDDFNEAFAALDAACGGMPKIAAGSYVGNGNYGSNNPTRVTFPFVPKIVFVITDGNAINGYFGMMLYPSVNFATAGNVGSGNRNTTAWSDGGKTAVWYSTSGAGPQLNVANTTYYWVALG